MKDLKTYHIELTGEDVEKIVTAHVSEMMRQQGYKVSRVNLDANYPWPDVHFIGDEDKSALTKA